MQHKGNTKKKAKSGPVFKDRLTSFICQWLQKIPRITRTPIIATLARLAWILDNRGRTIAFHNLSLAFPEKNSNWLKHMAKKSYINTAFNGADLLWLKEIEATMHNQHVIDEAIAGKKGVCLLTLHLGSWESLPSSLNSREYPVKVVTNIPKSFGFLQTCYKKAGISYICRKQSSTLIELVKACKQGEIICFFSDQFDLDVTVNLFGTKTRAPAGGISLAMMMKTAIIIGWSWKDSQKKHHVSFEPFQLEEAESRDATLRHNTQRLIDRFEALIKKYPEQWLWSYNRFKNPK